MSMFATKANENYDGLSIPNLDPAKYENCTLDKVEFTKTTKGDGTQGKEIITFTFATPDGLQHQHTEYAPDATNPDAKKVANMIKRIGHILTKFLPKDQTEIPANTFAELGNQVVAKLDAIPNRNEIKVDILVAGNVYQGKATSGFTGYPPFIAKHGEALQFDKNTLASNKQYYDHRAKASGIRPDAENTIPTGNEGISTAQGPASDF